MMFLYATSQSIIVDTVDINMNGIETRGWTNQECNEYYKPDTKCSGTDTSRDRQASRRDKKKKAI